MWSEFEIMPRVTVSLTLCLLNLSYLIKIFGHIKIYCVQIYISTEVRNQLGFNRGNKGFSRPRHLQGKSVTTGLVGQAWGFPLFDYVIRPTLTLY